MDYYQELLKSLGNTEDVEYLFKTQRESKPGYKGSYYAHHKGNKTTGFREPSDQKGKGHALQKQSQKTFFMLPDAADEFSRLFRNKDLATEMLPVKYDPKTKTGTVALRALEDGSHMFTGPFKKGDIIQQGAFTTEPKLGFAPVEMESHQSPRGSVGGAHFGSPISEVHPRPSRLGKAGIAAALAGGAGAASAGDIRRAAGDVAESFLPLGITPSTLAPGTLTPEQRSASDAATQRKRMQEEAAKMKAQAMLRAVPMPDEYRKGGRVRMI
jgi:hypothetical protein